MKKAKWMLLLLSAVMMCVLLVGCGSPEKTIQKIQDISYEERSQKEWIKLAKAYWETGDVESARQTLYTAKGYIYSDFRADDLLAEYILPAPTPNKDQGSYEGQLRLKFQGGLYSYGKLYVTVDRDEPFNELEIKEGVADDGIFVFEYPSEHDFYMDLYQPGEHTVRAFVVAEFEGELEVQSEAFEGKYTITGADYSNFAFSVQPGDHKAPVSLSISGAEGAKIYYSLNGQDPLFLSAGGANLHVRGKEFTEESIKLPIGKTVVRARAITENGLISPLLSGEYNVTITFDSASNCVAEDGYYEYIGTSAGLSAYDLTNDSSKESPWHSVWQRKISDMAVFTNKPENGNKVKTTIYARLVTGDVYMASISGGEAQNWKRVSSWDSIKNTGGWLIYPSETTGRWDYYSTATRKYYVRNAMWKGAGDQIGTEEVAKVATLMTDKMAVRSGTLPGGVRAVVATNPDGSNQRVLWNPEQSDYVVLQAMTDKLIFYNAQNKNMVFNIEKNKHFENTKIPSGASVLGYTSNAVYYTQGGTKRVALDYEEMAKQ